MAHAELKNVPSLGGWIMAVAAGLVAGGAAYVTAGFGVMQAGLVGVVVMLGVGLILGFPGDARGPVAAAPTVPASAPAPRVMAAAPAAPMAASFAAVPAAARRPAALTSARVSGADDLKRIKGVGPKLEELCHSLGFYHFDQIAAWTAEEIAWVDENLEGFKGRVTRDEWVAQAKVLAAGGETEFSKRVDDGEVY